MQTEELVTKAPSAIYRAGRLRVKPNNFCWAYTLDLASGVIFPALLGAGLAAICVAVVENVDGAAEWVQKNVYADQVIATLGTMLVFLISLRLGSNLAKNSSTIGHFGNLCGVCVNLAIWSRSLVNSDSVAVMLYPELKTTEQGTVTQVMYATTEIGLILSSIPYVVKYTYRGEPVKLEMLPIAGSPTLLARAQKLTAAGVVPFLAMVILLGQTFDQLEADGKIKPPELGLFYNQLNLLTGEEGSIGGIDGYSPPGVLNFLMYVLFFIYFALLSLGDLALNNSWQSLWIVGVLVIGNLGLFQLSQRYSNPFDVSPSRSTQKPIITDAARGTELAIDAIFGAPRSVKGASGLKALGAAGAQQEISLSLGYLR